MRQAQVEADAMVTEARSQVAAADDDDYRQAHEDAVQAGWSPAALAEMGYPRTRRGAAQRSQPVRVQQTDPGAVAKQTDASNAAARVA